jgi:hypothetical protein
MESIAVDVSLEKWISFARRKEEPAGFLASKIFPED